MATMTHIGWLRLIITAIVVIAVLLLVRLHPADGTAPPQISKGQRLTEAWCLECHAIDSDGAVRTGKNQGPDLRSIASKPTNTELALKVFLRSPHANMPNIIIQPGDADEIVHYILSLKRE
jgi:mono/diheme cytochrome c family protein